MANPPLAILANLFSLSFLFPADFFFGGGGGCGLHCSPCEDSASQHLGPALDLTSHTLLSSRLSRQAVNWVGSPAAEAVTVTVMAIPAHEDHILFRILDSGTTQLLCFE